MKDEQNPLVYLEYTPQRKLIDRLKPQRLFSGISDEITTMKYCMGYVSHPYEDTYRITTCRHLVASEDGRVPSKLDILKGLEVYARYEGVNKKFHSLHFEDVNIKIHEDQLTDLLFIEITHPDAYNFQLLNQASYRCRRRFPGSQVYFFQHHEEEKYFRLYEGEVSIEKIYITGIAKFDTIRTTDEVLIIGASGSPILSRRGEVIGMMCAHHQDIGRGIYLPIEKIERLYAEIAGYHE